MITVLEIYVVSGLQILDKLEGGLDVTIDIEEGAKVIPNDTLAVNDESRTTGEDTKTCLGHLVALYKECLYRVSRERVQ